MTVNSKKSGDERPDDFPLNISVDMNGDQSAAGLPGSAPPPNVRPDIGPKRGSMGHVATQADAGSDRSASSESESFDDDSGTARAGHNKHRGSDRESVRFQDDVADGEPNAAADGGGEGVKDKFQRQYRNVRCLKIIVILLLIVTAIVVTWAVYHFTRTDEQGDFELECE